MNPIAPPALSEIAEHWNELAALRSEQLESRLDTSWHAVLVPTIEQLLRGCNTTSIIDVGCGTGQLTARIGKRVRSITGIDISTASIAIANQRFGSRPNVTFQCRSAGGLKKMKSTFSAAYANMYLHNTPTLRSDLRSLSSVLHPNAVFAATIPHPCFWPTYWGYAEAPWFNYSRQIAIRGAYRISGYRDGKLETIHFHRPIATYFDALRNSGFVVDALVEPRPAGDLPAAYRAAWHYPRFLGIRCRKRTDPH